MRSLFCTYIVLFFSTSSFAQQIFGGNILDDLKRIVAHTNSNTCSGDTVLFPVEESFKTSQGDFIEIESKEGNCFAELRVFSGSTVELYTRTKGRKFYIEMGESRIYGKLEHRNKEIKKLIFDDGVDLKVEIKMDKTGVYHLSYSVRSDEDYSKLVDIYEENLKDYVAHFLSFVVFPKKYCEEKH